MKAIMYFFLMMMLVAIPLSGCTPYHAQGITAGAVVGGVTGALVDHHEPARGAVIGGTIGGLFGGLLGEAAYRNSYGSYPYYYEGSGYRQYDGGGRRYPSAPYYAPQPRYR